MIIDAHVHVGRASYLGLNATPEQLLRLADDAGIDRLFCTHCAALFYDMKEGNRALYGMLCQYPDRLIGYISIPSGRHGREALEEIERGVSDYGMKGLKIYSTTEVPISEPYTVEMIAKAAELGIPILAHSTPWACEQVAAEVPEAKLIMAHMGNTAIARGDWNWAIAAARRYPNIYLDTSGSTVDLGYLEAAVEAVGAERVIFGSDLPLFDAPFALAKTWDAEIDEEARRLILGGNIARLAGLDWRWQ